MTQPLIPTPIVDRNGRRTTVYRKPASSSAAVNLPPVKSTVSQSPTQVDRSALIESIRYNVSQKAARGRNMPELIPYLDNFDDDLLVRLKDYHTDDTHGYDRISRAILNRTVANELRELVHFSPLIHHDARDATARMLINSLREYVVQLPSAASYSKTEKPVREKAEALVRVLSAVAHVDGTSAFDGYGNTYPNRELIDLIVSSPEKAELMANVILGRKSTDVNMIREVLINDSVPMSDGVL